MKVTDHNGMEYFFTMPVKSATLENDTIEVINPYRIRLTFWRISSGRTTPAIELGGGLTDKEFEGLVKHLGLHYATTI